MTDDDDPKGLGDAPCEQHASEPVRDLVRAVAVVAAEHLPDLPTDTVALEVDIEVIARQITVLTAQLARRCALRDQAGPVPDTVARMSDAGLPVTRARSIRRAGVFAASFPDLQRSMLSGEVTPDQVAVLATAARKVPEDQVATLVDTVAPLLQDRTLTESRRLLRAAVESLLPEDPGDRERHDYAMRSLCYSASGTGVRVRGFLPMVEGGAFAAAVEALAEADRRAGDERTAGQRRADALAALVAVAGAHGLPSGGGLPAAVTLTVSLTEAERVAQRDPTRAPEEAVQGAVAASGGVVRGAGLGGDGRGPGGQPVGPGAVRFGLCAAAITPVLDGARPQCADGRCAPVGPPQKEHAGPSPGSLLSRIGATPVQPLAVGRAVRLATAAQRQALALRDGGCVIPFCTTAAPYAQPHHVTPWSLGGSTDLAELVNLCWVHHRQTELGLFAFHRRVAGEPAPEGAWEHPLWWIVPMFEPRDYLAAS